MSGGILDPIFLVCWALFVTSGLAIASPCSGQSSNGITVALEEAMRQLDGDRPGQCVDLFFGGDGGSVRRADLSRMSASTPVVSATELWASEKYAGAPVWPAACGRTVAVFQGGGDRRWLGKLPATKTTVYVQTSGEDEEMAFSGIGTASRALFLRVKEEDENSTNSCSVVDIYKRPDIFSGDLEKIATKIGNDRPLERAPTSSSSSSSSLIPGPQNNFRGAELRASAFDVAPYSEPDFEDPSNHGGFEFEIADIVARALGLDMVLRPPETGFMWDGVVGDLEAGLAEITWANFFVTPERAKVIDYTNWYLVEPNCFFVRRPRPYSGMYLLLLPLEARTWSLILLVLASVAAFYFASSRAEARQGLGPPEEARFVSLLFYEASIAFRESHRISHAKNRENIRVVSGFFMLTMLILCTAYSGALMSFFTVDVFPKVPATLDEVAGEIERRGMTLNICCLNVERTIQEGRSESYRIMSRRLHRFSWNLGPAFEDVQRETHVLLFGKYKAEIARRELQDQIPYDDLMITQECSFLPSYIALGLRKNSHFKPVVDKTLEQIKEAGIGREKIKLKRNREEKSGQQQRELELGKIWGLFNLYLVMVAVMLLVFLTERLHGRKSKRDGAVNRRAGNLDHDTMGPF